MVSSRVIVSCVFCVLVLTGCGAPPKQSVPRQTTYDLESPGEPRGGSASAEETEAGKTVLQPQEIRLPDDFLEELDISQVQGPLPSMSYVNDRIFEYGRKLERWREIDAESAALELSREDTEAMVNCFVDLQKVLTGYNQLRADMLRLNTRGSSIIISSEEVMNLQKSDISYLESVCGILLAPESDTRVDWEHREEQADLPQLETLIERYTENREYEEVIQVWQKIPEQQKDRVHLRTKILYGNALMFLHQEEQAAEIYQQIVDQMSVSDQQKTDLLSLRKVLADLYTASGNYAAAEGQYLNISKDYEDLGSIEEWSELQLNILERSVEDGPELAKYSNLLRNFLGFIPERDGFKIAWQADQFLTEYPYSAIASNVDIIKNTVQEKAFRWFNGFFNEVDALAQEKKYLDAIEKLEEIPQDVISLEQKERVKGRTDDLVLAEAVERETRKIEKMQELQSRWNEGMIKVEEGDYDAAIAIFQTLLQTEYYAKAEDKIKDITLLAAKTDRRAAADLYIRYGKTSDIEMKKKLLTESRRLLLEILTKYPDVDILDKVRGNIARVEQEMNSLDPTLLPSIQSAEAETESILPVGPMEDDLAFPPIQSQQRGGLDF
jgi:tetratricopeptide (TPR) repeat protein